MRKIHSTSKTKLFKEGSDLSKDMPFSNQTTDYKNSKQITVHESDFANGSYQIEKDFNISNFNASANKNEEFNRTIDSSRHSECISNKMTTKYSEFFDAAKQGNREKLNDILNSNLIPDVNITDLKSRTALHYAVNEGKFKTV